MIFPSSPNYCRIGSRISLSLTALANSSIDPHSPAPNRHHLASTIFRCQNGNNVHAHLGRSAIFAEEEAMRHVSQRLTISSRNLLLILFALQDPDIATVEDMDKKDARFQCFNAMVYPNATTDICSLDEVALTIWLEHSPRAALHLISKQNIPKSRIRPRILIMAWIKN
ncbi:hypothetical protein C8J56DRAFT_965364 [Mycena floridula]|nr:hypothetical protein C8J56DRAFT_965364 [Mycena floridula]